MKRINLTVIHIIIALVAVMFGSLKGQQNPILLSEKPEIIAYRLVPSWDVHCQIKIENVKDYMVNNIKSY